MNTAQLAGKLLCAWQHSNTQDLVEQLARTSKSLDHVRSISPYEREQQEVLRSVVDHLRGGESRRDTGGANGGALLLLRHLQGSASGRAVALAASESEKP